MLVANCVFMDFFVFLHVIPQQLLSLVAHFHWVFMWLTPLHDHVKLVTSSFVNFSLSSIITIASKAFSICCFFLCGPAMDCIQTYVSGWAGEKGKQTAHLNLCLGICGQINTDYHNCNWLWHESPLPYSSANQLRVHSFLKCVQIV